MKKAVKISELVPPGMRLRPYQAIGVKKILALMRVLLADVAGLGKTPQAIVAMNALDWLRCVIIAPPILHSNWVEELHRWLLPNEIKLFPNIQVIKTGNDKVLYSSGIIIISYDLVKKKKWTQFIHNYLNSDSNSLAILDEVHNVRSWSSDRTQQVLGAAVKPAKRAILITATPYMKSVEDFHTLFSYCEPGRWGKLETFLQQYSYPIQVPFGPGLIYKGNRNVEQLKEHMKRFVIRRFKKDVKLDLPEKVFIKIPLDLEESLPSTTIDRLDEQLPAIKEKLFGDNDDGPKPYSALMREMALAKLPYVIEWLRLFLDDHRDEQFIVYAYHKAVVAKLVEFFSDSSISVTSIVGQSSKTQKEEAYRGFQKKQYQVLVANIIAGGVGLNFQNCHNTVFAEYVWNHSQMSQAIDRMHRIGQTETCFIYLTVAQNTIEEDLIDVLKTKLKEEKKLLGPGKGNTVKPNAIRNEQQAP